MGILQSRGQLVVAEVARELGYTARTVYRDLSVLERVGVPIYQDRRGRRSRWRVMEGYRRRLFVTLSWTEALALAAGRAVLASYSGSLFDEAAGTAMGKIRAALPAELVERTQRVATALSASAGPMRDYKENAEVVRRVVETLDRRETIEIEYRKPGAGRHERRTVDPYHLHLQSGALYLLAWDHARGAVRTFLLDRVRGAKPTGRLFERAGEFSSGAFVQGAFGPWSGKPVRVELRFDRRAAAFAAELRMHPSQSNQSRDDGRLDVALRVPIGPALVSWLLGWGARVEVLRPKRLAEAVRLEHASAAGPVRARNVTVPDARAI